MRRLRLLLKEISFFALITQVLGQNRVCVNQSAVDTGEVVPYFQARFPGIPIKVPTRNPYLGGRNQTWCCIRAVDEYLRNNCSNTAEINVDERILDDNAQFPCGAAWIGDVAGAPKVRVTFAWSEQNRPGWQISEASNVNQWAQLLVAFILPCVVFSFNIPRPRKLKIWGKLFPTDIVSYRMVAGVFGAIAAAVIVTIDTVVWLMISFAFAGPLLLSGLYEAQLDKRVLHYLREHIKHDKLPLGFRARILFTILCGNLSLYPAWSDTMDLARHLDEIDKQFPELRRPLKRPGIRVSSPDGRANAPATSGSSVNNHPRASDKSFESYKSSLISQDDPTEDIADTEPLRPNDNETSQPYLGVIARDHSRAPSSMVDDMSLRKIKTASSLAESDIASLVEGDSIAQMNTKYSRFKTIRKVTVRLRAMLSCQYSFGSTIGGPVVFFLGSFIYALLEIKQNIGDENIAEALAFGMWWIIIPHVAAVAGLLLAGNNPNILAGIVSIRELRYGVGENLVERRLERRETINPEMANRLAQAKKPKKAYSGLMERVYEAEYTPAWMWDRGKCKQDWLLVLFTDSWLKYQRDGRLPTTVRKGLVNFLTEAVMLNFADWLFLWSFAFLLLFIPCLFGFLTAYYTPEIGIACRSTTFLVYMAAQTLLLLLWSYYLTKRDKYWHIAWKIKQILRKRPNHDSDYSLEKLIEQLRLQAIRDTTLSDSERRRQGDIIADRDGMDTISVMDRAHPVKKWVFYVLTTLGFAVSLFSSIGGSLFQIIGIYRTGLCLLKASDWTHKERALKLVTLSTNTFEAIREAQRDWLIIGAFSVVFLGTVCYIGWWYQKGLRNMFRAIAGEIDGFEEDFEDDHAHQ